MIAMDLKAIWEMSVYNNDKNRCLATPTGKGALSSADLKKLTGELAKIEPQIPPLAVQAVHSAAAKSKLAKLKKQAAAILAKLNANKLAKLVHVAKCAANSSQKWIPEPTAAATWQVK